MISANSAPAATTAPQSWAGKQLGTLRYIGANDGITTRPIHAGPLNGSNGTAPEFESVASFAAGVDRAQSLATDMEGYYAHGVMQAADGAWFVTSLGRPEADGFFRPAVIDGEQFDDAGFTKVWAERSTPDLAAVVGGEKVLDLRDTPFRTPAGPKVVVRDGGGRVVGAQG